MEVFPINYRFLYKAFIFFPLDKEDWQAQHRQKKLGFLLEMSVRLLQVLLAFQGKFSS